MRCPRCSQAVPEGAKQCPHCRIELRPPDSRATTTPGTFRSREVLEFRSGGDFCGRFMIIEKAAEGGMGVVYKAHDKVLNQQVALKLIQPDFAHVASFVERFKREVRVTRQITHPNVCRVHDLGEFEGLFYLSMEWISGETLADLLGQVGKLDTDRALEIAEKVALALDAAHSKGVIHRDLKPGNVMIDANGEIFVMDFGIAVEAASKGLTTSGNTPGTPLYMAPEQRWGGDVDARADLYALGLLLHSMLTGRALEPGPHAAARASAQVSRSIAPVLEKLLADDREQRYPSAKEAVEAIRTLRTHGQFKPPRPSGAGWIGRHRGGLWAGAAVAIVLAVGLIIRRTPFESPISDASVYYERGLHYLREESETLQSLDDAVHMFHRALALDSTSARAWAGLGEAYWTRYDRFDRNRQAPSRVEAERAVARSLELDPSLAEAHNARARGLIAEGNYREAKEELRRALSKKPKFDAAWANLARAHQGLQEYAEGLAAIEKAIRLNPTSFRHWISLGNFRLRTEEYDEAEKAYRKAVDLKPESPIAWRNLGSCLLLKGEPEKAAQVLNRSLQFEENARSRANLGTAYYSMKRYDLAAEQFRRSTELEPQNPVPWASLGDALTMLGKDQEAHDAYLVAVRLGRDRVEAAPLEPAMYSSLAVWCAKAGDLACARSEAARAQEMRPDDPQVLFSRAVIRCIEGRDDEAFELLEKATKLGLARAEIENDPALMRLHQNPRYLKILELSS